MRDLIKKIINEETNKILRPEIIALFKLLYSKRKELKTKKSVIQFFRDRLLSVRKDPKDAEMFYYLYTLNYRENGDFENIRPEEFIDKNQFPRVKTTNVSAGKFAYAKMPFEGSNLKGFWDKDAQGVDQYVITSYDWYPILIFKNEKWYSVIEKYSRATQRQYSNVSSKGIYNTIPLRSKDMQSLMDGKNEEQLQNRRIEEFMDNHSDTLLNSSFYNFMNFTTNGITNKISLDCTITNISIDGKKISINAVVKPKSKYNEIELNDSQKNEIERYFSAQIFVRTKILNPEDVKIDVKFVD